MRTNAENPRQKLPNLSEMKNNVLNKEGALGFYLLSIVDGTIGNLFPSNIKHIIMQLGSCS